MVPMRNSHAGGIMPRNCNDGGLEPDDGGTVVWLEMLQELMNADTAVTNCSLVSSGLSVGICLNRHKLLGCDAPDAPVPVLLNTAVVVDGISGVAFEEVLVVVGLEGVVVG
jgi:hypothetical protein